MFYSKLKGTPAAPDGLSARALHASNAAAHNAQTAAQAAQSAAQAAQAAAQSAAQEMGKSVKHGVVTARGWAAPRLEQAADYYTEAVAPKVADALPKVADALRTTAHQVQPETTGKRKFSFRSAIAVSMLAAAGFAAAGAVAALVRRRYKAAMEADTESDIVDIEDGDEPVADKHAPMTEDSASTSGR